MSVITSEPTGPDLHAERRRVGLRQQDVAQVMGVDRSRIAHLELMFHPPARAVERYIAALSQASADE
jgi:predicted transcriptional regulator